MVTNQTQNRQAVFRSIADPTRRKILDLLRDGEKTVGDLAVDFQISRPAVSKHLRILESAGLVVARRHGTARICTLDARPLSAVETWLRDYESFWSDSLRQLKNYVEGRRER